MAYIHQCLPVGLLRPCSVMCRAFTRRITMYIQGGVHTRGRGKHHAYASIASTFI